MKTERLPVSIDREIMNEDRITDKKMKHLWSNDKPERLTKNTET